MNDTIKTISFHRSYYDAILLLPENDRIKIYSAICEYAFNGKEPHFENIELMAWTLIKPNLDSSLKYTKFGSTGGRGNSKKEPTTQPPLNPPLNPPLKREEKKGEEKKGEDIEHPLQGYVKKTFPEVSKLKTQLTFENCEKLVKQFDKNIIDDVLKNMENHGNLTKKYKSVYLTLLDWCKRRVDSNPPAPPELSKVPHSAIFPDNQAPKLQTA